MIATPQPLDPDHDAVFARQLLALSAELDATEARIKREIIAAAKSGDIARVLRITRRWMRLPTLQVLDGEQGGHDA